MLSWSSLGFLSLSLDRSQKQPEWDRGIARGIEEWALWSGSWKINFLTISYYQWYFLHCTNEPKEHTKTKWGTCKRGNIMLQKFPVLTLTFTCLGSDSTNTASDWPISTAFITLKHSTACHTPPCSIKALKKKEISLSFISVASWSWKKRFNTYRIPSLRR